MQHIIHKITDVPIENHQHTYEIRHSLISTVIFGLSAIPVVYLVRQEVITLLPNTLLNIILGLVLLTAWNEIHFFIVHRIMHLPFFMRRVHYIHHRSHIPTTYSVYSFHWLEALLLSTVPITIAPLVNFAPAAIFLYPLASILLNFSGHCNYRFGNGTGNRWVLFATNHNAHHSKGKKNYGFASFIPDLIYNKLFNIRK